MNGQFTPEQTQERLFGLKIRNKLNAGNGRLSRHVTERLFTARQTALSQYPISAGQVSFAGSFGNFGQHLINWGNDAWRPIAIALMLVTLAVGSDYWQSLQRAADLEEVDSALLADDLPISAYLDRGFDAWLKNSAQR
ncbi:MAG TPA: DUF3619 family protein [Rhodocyclaceae bacterium]|nr:DUF3619 family protein [Rhodocyclaceae bacterium]